MANKIFLEDSSIGNMGSELYLGADSIDDAQGTYYAIHFLTAVSPGELSFRDSLGYNLPQGTYTIPAGTIIYGDLISIETVNDDDAFILYKR